MEMGEAGSTRRILWAGPCVLADGLEVGGQGKGDLTLTLARLGPEVAG